MLLGLVVALVVALIVFGVLSSVKREIKAGRELDRTWRTGVPARAPIVAVRDTGSRLGDRPHQIPKLAFDLEIEREEGAPVGASIAFYVRPEIRERMNEGAELDVRVDAVDPTKVAVDPELRLLGSAGAVSARAP